MTGPRTLLDFLVHRARETPEHEAVRFRSTPTEEESVSYTELWARARSFASRLLAAGLEREDRVVVALPNGPDFLVAFYGVLAAGGAAVPVYARVAPERTLQILGLSGARLLVVPPEGATSLRSRAREEEISALTVGGHEEAPMALPDLDPEANALVQYTSGSTADPRGVLIPHRHLLVNLEQMRLGMEITPRDVFVSWLPVHHDMGLILMALMPLYVGARLVLLPTSLHSPHPWLSAISDHRGTFTAAPDSAYRLCALRGDREGRYDLSSLRVALNAAEPVRRSTVESFEAAFGLSRVVAPAYGLAEATVGVSMAPPGSALRLDEGGRPSVGRPFPGVSVRIVEEGRDLPLGEVGEIVVRSPAVTPGYLGNEEATASLLTPEGDLLTGDLGTLDREGALYVVGRKKNVIHQAGQTLYAADVEGAVADLPFVRRVAAVAMPGRRALGERLFLFVEVGSHRLPPDRARELSAEVVQRVHGRFGTRPARVCLLVPGSMPRTPNGKLQHHALRDAFLAGDLDERVLFP